MIGLSVVNSASNSGSGMPWGCSESGCSRIRSTTFTTRTFSCGRRWRIRSTAASVSRVGMSPAQAMTTSGSPSSSLLANSQIPIPRVQWRTASSMDSQFSEGCFPATMTFT